FFFFFQAEDGIRDRNVTGVQTCALPISAFQFLRQDRRDAAALAELIRTVGPSRVVLSSDVGQPASPGPARALTTLIDALAAEGIAREQLETMAGRQAEQLVIP